MTTEQRAHKNAIAARYRAKNRLKIMAADAACKFLRHPNPSLNTHDTSDATKAT